ncbi:hypothetical protein [Paraburkholderia sp. 40]|uniref:hypothetical protein n=1 Tax=Paraburkholderia sp. 40 TaxID=2991059 RepID=UPI003D235620
MNKRAKEGCEWGLPQRTDDMRQDPAGASYYWNVALRDPASCIARYLKRSSRRSANGVRHGASLSSNQIPSLIQRLDRTPESQSRTPAGRDEFGCNRVKPTSHRRQ